MIHRVPKALVAIFMSLVVAAFIFGLTGAIAASSLPRTASVRFGADVETAPHTLTPTESITAGVATASRDTAQPLPIGAAQATSPQALAAVPNGPMIAGESIVTIANESFEGTFPPAGWTASGHWGKSSCQARVGSFSAWVEGAAGLPCSSVYHQNEQSALTFGPFDLNDALTATLEFDLWLWSAQGDIFSWGASSDGVNFYGYSLVNVFQTLWGARSLDLSAVPTLGDLRGESSVWIRFAWSTDNFAAAFDGAYVDNVRITKRAVPRVDVVKWSDRATVDLGGSVTYTIAITSTGLADTPAARLTDTLPLNLALTGGPFASMGAVGAAGQVITWTGPVSIGQSIRVTYTAALVGQPPDGTPLVNAVTVDDGAGKVFAAVPVTTVVTWSRVYLPVTLRNYTPPPPDYALLLDGVNDYASTPDQAELDLSTSGDSLTIEAWFNADAFAAAPDVDVIGCKFQTYCLFIYTQSGLKTVAFRLHTSPGSYSQLTSGSTVFASGWHHLAGVFDNASNQTRLYLDGALQVSGAFSSDVPNTSYSFFVGGLDGGNWFDGKINEIRLSNSARYSGSAYTVPIERFTCDANTVGLWHFDESPGATTFYDGEDDAGSQCGSAENTLTGLNGAATGTK